MSNGVGACAADEVDAEDVVPFALRGRRIAVHRSPGRRPPSDGCGAHDRRVPGADDANVVERDLTPVPAG